jgi:tetratricopeptide (TPR) repeat protein
MRKWILVLLLVAGPALAEETRSLTFKDGKRKSAVLESFDAAGITVRIGGRRRTLDWSDLTPASAYRARAALTPYDDGAARLELSLFATGLRLYPEALEQLEIALALGGLDEAAFEKREAEIEDLEVEYLCRRIDELLLDGSDPRTCLQAIKRLRERYPENENNAAYEGHVDALVRKLAQEAMEKQAEETRAAEDAELAGLRRGVQKIQARKRKALEKAEALRKESEPAIEKGQVSRVKRKLVEPSGAERYYKKARSHLRALARLDKHFRIVEKDALQKEYEAIEKRLIECYLGVARILMKGRNYKGAVEYVRKILYYDPIHEEALEMVEEIRRNRITFKLSDITNARPRVTGG